MDLRSFFDFSANFNIIMLLISALFAMWALPFKNKRLKYLLFYLVFAIFSNIVSYLTKGSGNNLYLSYLITPVYLVLFTFLLMPEKREKGYFLSLILMVVGISLNLYEAFGIEGGVSYYNSLSNVYISIFLGALSIRGLLELRYSENVLNLAREPMFWILVAIAIKNIGNLISTGFYRSLQNVEGDILLKVVLMSTIINYLGMILYWVGFIKAKPKK